MPRVTSRRISVKAKRFIRSYIRDVSVFYANMPNVGQDNSLFSQAMEWLFGTPNIPVFSTIIDLRRWVSGLNVYAQDWIRETVHSGLVYFTLRESREIIEGVSEWNRKYVDRVLQYHLRRHRIVSRRDLNVIREMNL